MKNKYNTLATLLIFGALVFQSCTVSKIGGRGPVPIMLNQPVQKVELMEHIAIKKNINFDYSGYTDVSSIIAGYVTDKKPDAVINTTISFKAGADNFFINLFTLGLAQSRKVMIEADFVKNAPASGN